jgi:cyclohexanecarboxylate-CoA ligase
MADMWDSLRPVSPARAAEFYQRGWWRRETFHDDLARATRDRPGAPAVIAYQNGEHARTLTYTELTQTVDRFAAALAELGVGRGDVVVVHLPNWWMLTPLYLACGRLRAVVATVVPAFGGRDLRHVLETTQAKACIVPDHFIGVDYAARLKEVAPDTLEHRIVVGDAAATGALDFTEFFVATPWEQTHPPSEFPRPEPDDPAHIVFTSGTTGRPKGVVHSFNTMWAATRAFSDVYRLGPGDPVIIPHYLTHLAGSAYAIWMPVAIGGTVVIQDTISMDLLLDLVARHRITLMFGAPMYIIAMVEAQRAKPRDLSSLRCLNTGSAPVPPPLVAQAGETLNVRLDSNFGMTEVGAITLTRADDPEGWAGHSDGSPVDWMEIRIDTPPGDRIGRLLVRGASLCLGYLNHAEAFEACLDADGFFDTADTARDDGRGGIKITGRRVDLVVRGNGLLTPVLEVEGVLIDHPAVKDVVIIPYRDPAGTGADLACAIVVPDGAPPTLSGLIAYLDERQVSPRDRPDRLETAAELPRNPQGKVLRTVLRQGIE